jgi:hypothetical protein
MTVKEQVLEWERPALSLPRDFDEPIGGNARAAGPPGEPECRPRRPAPFQGYLPGHPFT